MGSGHDKCSSVIRRQLGNRVHDDDAPALSVLYLSFQHALPYRTQTQSCTNGSDNKAVATSASSIAQGALDRRAAPHVGYANFNRRSRSVSEVPQAGQCFDIGVVLTEPS